MGARRQKDVLVRDCKSKRFDLGEDFDLPQRATTCPHANTVLQADTGRRRVYDRFEPILYARRRAFGRPFGDASVARFLLCQCSTCPLGVHVLAFSNQLYIATILKIGLTEPKVEAIAAEVFERAFKVMINACFTRINANDKTIGFRAGDRSSIQSF